MSAFYRLEERERGRECVSEGEEKTRKIHTDRGGRERGKIRYDCKLIT